MSGLGRAAVVVPCHNEASRLVPDAFIDFVRAAPNVQIVFVDDGSTDGTFGVLEQLRAAEPARISVVQLSANVGKGEAIRAGLMQAFGLDVEYWGYWDADLATPLAVILDFCRLLDAHPDKEMVFGTRVRLLGRNIARDERRHYLGRVSATIISLTLGLRVYDTQCGAKLFRASPEMRLLFEPAFVSGWIFDVEIIARLIHARRHGAGPGADAVIYEHPLDDWHDVAGSNIRPRDYVRAGVDLWRIYQQYLRRG